MSTFFHYVYAVAALLQHILKQGMELKLMMLEAKDMLIHLTSLMIKNQPAPAENDHLLPEDLILPVKTQQELIDLEGLLDDDSFQELLVCKADFIVKAVIEMITICGNYYSIALLFLKTLGNAFEKGQFL